MKIDLVKEIKVFLYFARINFLEVRVDLIMLFAFSSLLTGHEDCLELLLEHNPFAYLEGNPFTPLHCAV